MRPPHYAGENERGGQHEPEILEASMRPPHYAGENVVGVLLLAERVGASMRPPHYAGENLRSKGAQARAGELQ